MADSMAGTNQSSMVTQMMQQHVMDTMKVIDAKMIGYHRPA